MRVRQGRCRPCGVRYVWRGQVELRQARCPRCGTFLKASTRALQQPTVKLRPKLQGDLVPPT